MVKFAVGYQGAEVSAEVTPDDYGYFAKAAHGLFNKLTSPLSKNTQETSLEPSTVVEKPPAQPTVESYREKRNVIFNQFQEVADLHQTIALHNLRAQLKPVVEKQAEQLAFLLKPAATRANSSLAATLK